MAAYAEPADMSARHDIDVVGDLVSDDRARLSRMDVLAHPNLQVALDDASGEIEVAMRRGGIYDPEQLEGLTGNAKSHLTRVTCWIAMALLFERRPGVHTEMADRYLERAEQYKQKLQSGDNIFGLDGQKDASMPTVDGPTALEYQTLNLIPERMHRYFPSSGTRIPLNRRGGG